jgi:site-specific recombinase XerD
MTWIVEDRDEGNRVRISKARARYVRWLLVTKDLSPHTLRAYDGDLTSFERYLGVDVDSRKIDRACLLSFLEAQKAAGLSPASLRRRASALRGFCRWMILQGGLEVDPWSDISLKAGRSKTLPRTVPTHELSRLIEHLKVAAGFGAGRIPEARLVRSRPYESTTLLAVVLMVATGVRVNEAIGIRCPDIDLPGRTVRLLGKGGRERQVFLSNDWIADLTRAYMEARFDLELEHPYLLFNRHHDPLTPPAMRSRLANAGCAAGVGRRLTPHMLRHTAATQLIEAGVDIRYIQRLLGHASLATTEIYTHVSDRALRRVVSDADVLGRVTHAR